MGNSIGSLYRESYTKPYREIKERDKKLSTSMNGTIFVNVIKARSMVVPSDIIKEPKLIIYIEGSKKPLTVPPKKQTKKVKIEDSKNVKNSKKNIKGGKQTIHKKLD